jgi:hypothetical protein
MTTRLTWAAVSRELGGAARLGRPVGGPVGWRSHTFGDEVRSLTLTGPLDVATAGRLWMRISELVERGCRRLIVDASAIEPVGDEPTLLAGVFVGPPASYRAVVVAPRGSALVDLLPAWVGITSSLSEARRQLTSGIVRRDARKQSGPGGAMPPGERHALAVRQSLRWAERSAREGDYERALGWLAMVERVEGALREPWPQRRRAWLAAWQAQTTGAQRPGSGPSPPG